MGVLDYIQPLKGVTWNSPTPAPKPSFNNPSGSSQMASFNNANGNVLGLNNTANNNKTTSSGGGGGGNSGGNNGGGGGGGGGQPSGPDFGALMAQIDSIANEALAGLEPQRQAQEGIVNNTYNQGVSDLQAQEAAGSAQLDTQTRHANENQVKTLLDLDEGLRNSFQAGNTYLGARGAGDSSAAGQYAFALTKEANKNRGRVMSETSSIVNDIADRASQLKMQVVQGIKQLATEKQNQLLGVAQWFANAQNQIRAAKGQNVVALGQQALNYAMNAVSQINADNQARQNALFSWAANNATTIQGLKSNLQQISTINPTFPQAGSLPGLTGGAVGSNGQYFPGSGGNTKEKNLFGV